MEKGRSERQNRGNLSNYIFHNKKKGGNNVREIKNNRLYKQVTVEREYIEWNKPTIALSRDVDDSAKVEEWS